MAAKHADTGAQGERVLGQLDEGAVLDVSGWLAEEVESDTLNTRNRARIKRKCRMDLYH